MSFSVDINNQKITSCFLSQLGTDNIQISGHIITKLGIVYTGCIPDNTTTYEFFPLQIIIDNIPFYLGKTGVLQLQNCSIQNIIFLNTENIETNKLYITYEWE